MRYIGPMAVLPLVFYPSKILSVPTTAVTSFDSTLGRLLDDMRETMYESNGVGLAAPQIGSSLRVAVIDVSDERNEFIELVNPQIIARAGKATSEEGCLSIPGFRESIERSKTVTVRAMTREGKPFEISGEELKSYCLQHEIDHLDGRLFVDHLSRLKREIFRKWAAEEYDPPTSSST